MTQPSEIPSEPGQIATRWKCPQADYEFVRTFASQTIPACPTHATALVRAPDIIIGAS